MIAVFVWTFKGVIDAIAVGFVLLVLLIMGIIYGCMSLSEWWVGKKKAWRARRK